MQSDEVEIAAFDNSWQCQLLGSRLSKRSASPRATSTLAAVDNLKAFDPTMLLFSRQVAMIVDRLMAAPPQRLEYFGQVQEDRGLAFVDGPDAPVFGSSLSVALHLSITATGDCLSDVRQRSR